MTLAELVPALREHTRITVTGPQRAGTTIAAYIISRELGYGFLPEEAFGVTSLHRYFRLYDAYDRIVFQAPCLCAYAHALPGAVVLMRRDLEDILRSQVRIGWDDRGERKSYFTEEGPTARVRYAVWERYQKPRMEHAFELEYESLRAHPLWLDPELRAQFHPRQIRLGTAEEPTPTVALRCAS